MNAAPEKLNMGARAYELTEEVAALLKRLKALDWKAEPKVAGQTGRLIQRIDAAVNKGDHELTITTGLALKTILVPILASLDPEVKKPNKSEPIAKLRATEARGLFSNLESAGWTSAEEKNGEAISRLLIRLDRCEAREQWTALRRHADALCEILRPLWRDKSIARRKLWRLTFKNGISRGKYDAIVERLELRARGCAAQLSPVKGESGYITAAELRTNEKTSAEHAAKLITAHGAKRGTNRVKVVSVEEVFQAGY